MQTMTLVCDSGSTKADWIFIGAQGRQLEFQTDGLNPVHLTEETISEIISSQRDLISKTKGVSEIFFFGAGCGSSEGKTRMTNALKTVFADSKITVDNDLMAAALASSGNEKGIISILGTGSNCCFYDGSIIQMKNFGLGYILGDEASGAWFGKKFLRAFLYGQLPKKIHDAFYEEYKLNREKIIESVYRKPNANLFFSSFMPFIMKNKSDQYMLLFLKDGLEEFFETNIQGFPESEYSKIHFVGSVAALLEPEIREIGKTKNLTIGKILKRPMDGLKNYFLSK